MGARRVHDSSCVAGLTEAVCVENECTAQSLRGSPRRPSTTTAPTTTRPTPLASVRDTEHSRRCRTAGRPSRQRRRNGEPAEWVGDDSRDHDVRRGDEHTASERRSEFSESEHEKRRRQRNGVLCNEHDDAVARQRAEAVESREARRARHRSLSSMLCVIPSPRSGGAGESRTIGVRTCVFRARRVDMFRQVGEVPLR